MRLTRLRDNVLCIKKSIRSNCETFVPAKNMKFGDVICKEHKIIYCQLSFERYLNNVWLTTEVKDKSMLLKSKEVKNILYSILILLASIPLTKECAFGYTL